MQDYSVGICHDDCMLPPNRHKKNVLISLRLIDLSYFSFKNKWTAINCTLHKLTLWYPGCNLNFPLGSFVIFPHRQSKICSFGVFHDEKEERRCTPTTAEPLCWSITSQCKLGNAGHICHCGHQKCAQGLSTLHLEQERYCWLYHCKMRCIVIEYRQKQH